MVDFIKTLDEKIAPLVIALNKVGIQTSMSCEGHILYIDERNTTNKTPYTYVLLKRDPNFVKLKQRIFDGMVAKKKNANIAIAMNIKKIMNY